MDLTLQEADRTDPTADELEVLRLSLRSTLQHLRTMEKRMEKLDPLAIGGRGRTASEIGLGEVLSDVLAAFEDEFRPSHRVLLDFKAESRGQPADEPRGCAASLANLVDNALFWAPKERQDS